MLKLLGSLLVLVCSTGLGAAGAWDVRQHCRELRVLKQAVYMLRGEIKYARSPLPEVFGSLAVRAAPPFDEFFAGLEQAMSLGDGRSLRDLWQEELRLSLKKSALRGEEKQKLMQLGEGLGYLDLDMQLATIELYLEQLDLDLARAQEELAARQKLCRSLGVAGGIFLVILLI